VQREEINNKSLDLSQEIKDEFALIDTKGLFGFSNLDNFEKDFDRKMQIINEQEK